MTPTETEVWAKVYAAVICGGGLPHWDPNWKELRERAAAEAKLAVLTLRKGVL
jgi:hypothetical protein